MKTRIATLSVVLLVLVLFALSSNASWAADAGFEDQGASMQMMERVEVIIYGEPRRGGLAERLNSIERELFGRELPGSISERHAAILNFLEVGTPDQPSMIFKIGIAEWLVGDISQVRRGVAARVERLETGLDGTMQYGRPLAMRVERLLASLLADPVTFQDVTLPTATVLQAQFLDELGPATTSRGDIVNLALTSDLMVGNVLVAPRGSLIDAVVSSVRQPGIFGVPSRIRIDFRSLIPLGPQRPSVVEGEASRIATNSRGEGAMAGAGAAGIGGAILLGPLGLALGGLVRGDAVRIPEGSTIFLETYGDTRVSGFPIPASLRATQDATGVQPPRQPGEREIIELPAEHIIN